MIELELHDYSKKRVVYKEKTKEIGYILLEETIDVINIIDVFVKEEYRRLGIASKLFEYVFNMYKSCNVKFMLEVRNDNLVAYKLYSKLGFKDVCIRKKYYKDVDAIIMEAINI